MSKNTKTSANKKSAETQIPSFEKIDPKKMTIKKPEKPKGSMVTKGYMSYPEKVYKGKNTVVVKFKDVVLTGPPARKSIIEEKGVEKEIEAVKFSFGLKERIIDPKVKPTTEEQKNHTSIYNWVDTLEKHIVKTCKENCRQWGAASPDDLGKFTYHLSDKNLDKEGNPYTPAFSNLKVWFDPATRELSGCKFKKLPKEGATKEEKEEIETFNKTYKPTFENVNDHMKAGTKCKYIVVEFPAVWRTNAYGYDSKVKAVHFYPSEQVSYDSDDIDSDAESDSEEDTTDVPVADETTTEESLDSQAQEDETPVVTEDPVEETIEEPVVEEPVKASKKSPSKPASKKR